MMKIHDSINHFWNAYQSSTSNKFGFDDWAIVRFIHTSDADYAGQQQNSKDELGFQPLSVILANPFTHESKHEVIKDVTDQQFGGFWQHYTNHFMNQLDNRFGVFRPDKFDAYTEYDNWDSFSSSWIERAGKPVIMHNFPLLFDHLPKVDHWARRQTGQEVLPYQRLIVTTYFVGKNEFFDFIIKDVSDEQMAHIKLLMQSRIGLNLDTLFTPQKEV